jgi:hypothetical protein
MMKKLLLGLVLLFYAIRSSGQVPPNLLTRSEAMVKFRAEALKAHLISHDTTRKGKLLLHYQIINHSNSKGNTLYYILFRFDLPDSCTICDYGYAGRADFDDIVTALDKNKKLKRKENALGWRSINNKFDVDIHQFSSNGGFSLTYTWLGDIKPTESLPSSHYLPTSQK